MSFFLLFACCHVAIVSMVAVGRKRARSLRTMPRTSSQIVQTSRQIDATDLNDMSDENEMSSKVIEDNATKRAKDLDISTGSYKRRRDGICATSSAFYDRAARMSCGSKLTFKDVQNLAAASVRDSQHASQQPNHGSMALASLGCFGKHPQNCERDFHRLQASINKHENIDIELFYTKIQLHDPREGAVDKKNAFMLPHEMMSYLYENPEAWNHAILGGDEKTDFAAFWQFYADNNAEWYLRHPISTLTPEERAKTIPIGLHGDDVHVYKTSTRYKVLAMEWNSVFARCLGSMLSRFCMFMLPYEMLLPGSLNQALEIISWSLQACFKGEWPMFTHDGQVPKG